MPQEILDHLWAGGEGQGRLRQSRERVRKTRLDLRNYMAGTRTNETRFGGVPLLFAMPEGRTIRNSASKIVPGIDIRGEGGVVIVPSSPNYALQHHAPIVAAPGWLLDLVDPPPKPLPAPPPRTIAPFARNGRGSRYALAALDNETRAILSAPDGAKHATINRAAFSIGGLVAGGALPEGGAFAALRSALAGIAGRCADFRAAEKTLGDCVAAWISKNRLRKCAQQKASITAPLSRSRCNVLKPP